RALGDVETALNGRAGQAAFQPGRNLFQSVEFDELARPIEADQIAHPAERRDVGDGVDVPHDPVATGEPGLKDVEKAFRFGAIALERAFVRDLPASELMEEADLAEHRADRRHLEEYPLERLVAASSITRQELAGLLREIDKDGARFEESERCTVRTR